VFSTPPSRPSLGIIGFGAFGRLMAAHLRPWFELYAHDPAAPPMPDGIEPADLPTVARCAVVVLAVPVSQFESVVRQLGPHLSPGTLVLDVGSVKVVPSEIMLRGLPGHVDIVATHPLFGPQSAADGLAGLKIAVCPLRGGSGGRVAAFLRKCLGLTVIVTTPEAHDREAAMVQGLTHLIAKVLVQMEPLPSRMTTRSFDLLVRATNMVRYDAAEVFEAIERTNPFAASVRRRFFDLAADLDHALEGRKRTPPDANRSF
jgi:prephenate dehydrogenase